MQDESTVIDLAKAKAMLENPRVVKALQGPSKYLSWCVSAILRAHQPPHGFYGESLRMNDHDRYQIALEQLAIRASCRGLKTIENAESAS